MSDAPDSPTGVVEVALEDLVRSIEVEEAATTEEATALAAAVGAHLSDRESAAAAETAERTETVDPWAFAGRLESAGVRRRGRPRPVERGREWRAAARY